MSDSVYAVAVNTQPVLWVIHCELCNDEFGSPTDNEAILQLLENEHLSAHGLGN